MCSEVKKCEKVWNWEEVRSFYTIQIYKETARPTTNATISSIKILPRVYASRTKFAQCTRPIGRRSYGEGLAGQETTASTVKRCYCRKSVKCVTA